MTSPGGTSGKITLGLAIDASGLGSQITEAVHRNLRPALDSIQKTTAGIGRNIDTSGFDNLGRSARGAVSEVGKVSEATRAAGDASKKVDASGFDNLGRAAGKAVDDVRRVAETAKTPIKLGVEIPVDESKIDAVKQRYEASAARRGVEIPTELKTDPSKISELQNTMQSRIKPVSVPTEPKADEAKLAELHRNYEMKLAQRRNIQIPTELKTDPSKVDELTRYLDERLGRKTYQIPVDTSGLEKVGTSARTAASEVGRVPEAMAQAGSRGSESMRGLSDSVGGLKGAFSGVIDNMTASLGPFGNVLNSVRGSLSQMEGGIGSFAAKATGLVTVVAAVGAGLFKLGSQFHELNKELQVKTGAKGEELEALRGTVEKLGTTNVALPLKDIGTIAADVTRNLHLTGKPLEDLTSRIANLGRMTGEQLNVDKLGQVFRMFGTSAEDQSKALDQLFAMSQKTGLSVNEMITALASRGSPALKNMGLDVSQSAALLGQFEKAGLDSKQMLQGLSMAQNNLAKQGKFGTDALREQIAAIKQLIEEGRAAEKSGNAEEAQKKLAMAAAMAKATFGQRAGQAFFEGIESGALDLANLDEALKAVNGDINQTAKDTRTWAGSWQKLKNSMSIALEPVATAVFDAISGALTSLFGVVTRNMGAFKTLAAVIAALAAPTIAIKTAMVAARAAMAAYHAAGMLFSNWAKIATAVQWAWNAALSANPIGLVVVAIGAAVAALVLFFTKTELGKQIWSNFVTFLKGAWEWISTTIPRVWNENIKPVFEAIWNWLKGDLLNAWNLLRDTVVAVWNFIAGIISDVWAGIQIVFEAIRGWVVDNLLPIWEQLRVAIAAAWDFIRDAVVSAWNTIRDTVSVAWDAIRTVFDAMVTFLHDSFAGAWTWLRDHIVATWESLRDGAQIIWDAIRSVFDTVISFVQDVFSAVWTWLRDHITATWDGIREAVSAAWETIRSVFDTVISFVQDTFAAAWTWLKDHIESTWQAISDAVSAAWDGIRSVFDTVVEFIRGTLGDAWTWLKDHITEAWQAAGDLVSSVWNDVIKATWDTLVEFIRGTLAEAWTWLKDHVTEAWTAAGELVRRIWDEVIKATWDTLVEFIRGTLSEAWTWLKDHITQAWTAVGDLIKTVWENTIMVAWDAMKAGLDTLAQWFDKTVNNIQTIWERVKEAVAAPVRFVVQTVYNQGIREAWNKIASFIGAEELPEATIGFRRGGLVTGGGGGKGDRIPASGPIPNARYALSAGEFIIPADVTSRIGVDNLNYLIHNKGQGDGLLTYYKEGGLIEGSEAYEALMRAHQFAQQHSGKPYVLGGSLPGGSTDCSGFMSGIADVIAGGSGGRQWATMAFSGGGNSQTSSGPQGFVEGLGFGFSIGVKNGGPAGGHTAGTLSEVGPYSTTNVESSGDGGVMYGGNAIGADDPMFTMRYHLPISDDAFITGGPGAGGGGGSSGGLWAIAKRIWDSIINAIDVSNDFGGKLAEWPKKFLETMAAKIWAYVSSLLPRGGGSGGDWDFSDSGTSPESGEIVKQIIAIGKDLGMPEQVIKSCIAAGIVESNLANLNHGDRDSLGIFQMRPSMGWGSPAQLTSPTYAINKWYDTAKGVPGWEAMDPGALAQAVEKSAFPEKYGAAMGRAGQLYSENSALVDAFDEGGIASGTGVMPKNVLAPERVLSPEQTKLFEALVAALQQIASGGGTGSSGPIQVEVVNMGAVSDAVGKAAGAATGDRGTRPVGGTAPAKTTPAKTAAAPTPSRAAAPAPAAAAAPAPATTRAGRDGRPLAGAAARTARPDAQKAEQLERIRELAARGMSAAEIASIVGLSEATVRSDAKDAGIELARGKREPAKAPAAPAKTPAAKAPAAKAPEKRPTTTGAAKPSEVVKEEGRAQRLDKLQEYADKGMSAGAIAQMLGVSPATVEADARAAGISLTEPRGAKKAPTKQPATKAEKTPAKAPQKRADTGADVDLDAVRETSKIEDLAATGMSVAQIAAALDMSESDVRARAKAAGIEITGKKEAAKAPAKTAEKAPAKAPEKAAKKTAEPTKTVTPRTDTEAQRAERQSRLSELVEQGMSAAEIAEALGVSEATVRADAKAAGISLPGKPEVAKKAPEKAAAKKTPEAKKTEPEKAKAPAKKTTDTTTADKDTERDERRRKVAEMAGQGKTAAQIAEALGISESQVRADAKAEGVELAKKEPAKAPAKKAPEKAPAKKEPAAKEPAKKEPAKTAEKATTTDKEAQRAQRQSRLQELVDQGMSVAQIAEALGVSESTVRADAKAAGIELPSKREPAKAPEKAAKAPEAKKTPEKAAKKAPEKAATTKADKDAEVAERRKKVADLAAQGKTAAQIGAELGITESTVRSDAKAAGIELPSAKKAPAKKEPGKAPEKAAAPGESPQKKAADAAKTPEERGRERAERLSKIKELASQGMSATEIAAALGVSESTVREDAKGAGIKLPKAAKKAPAKKEPGKAAEPEKAKKAEPEKAPAKKTTGTPEEKGQERAERLSRIKELAAQGMSAAEIAEALGVSEATVRDDAKTAGVKLPKAAKKAPAKKEPGKAAEPGKKAPTKEPAKKTPEKTTERGAKEEKEQERAERVSRIRELASEGMSAAEIAAALDVTEATVRSDAKKAGIELPGKKETAKAAKEPAKKAAAKKTAEPTEAQADKTEKDTERAERISRIKELAEEGMNAAEIAAALDISETTVRSDAKKAGIDLPTGKKEPEKTTAKKTTAKAEKTTGKKTTDTDKQQDKAERLSRIRELATEGMSAAEIAAALDVSESQVRADAKAAGITLPKPSAAAATGGGARAPTAPGVRSVPGMPATTRTVPGTPTGRVPTGVTPSQYESGMVENNKRLMALLEERYPGLKLSADTARSDVYGEHGSGEALDIMVGPDTELGNEINEFLKANAEQLGLQYTIWQQAMHYPGQAPEGMPDRGDATQNHMDHVHARVTRDVTDATGDLNTSVNTTTRSLDSTSKSVNAAGTDMGAAAGALKEFIDALRQVIAELRSMVGGGPPAPGAPTTADTPALGPGFDAGGTATGRGYLQKNIITPERVLSPQQTLLFDTMVLSLQSIARTQRGGGGLMGILSETGMARAMAAGMQQAYSNMGILPEPGTITGREMEMEAGPQGFDARGQVFSDTLSQATRTQTSIAKANAEKTAQGLEVMGSIAGMISEKALVPVINAGVSSGVSAISSTVQQAIGANLGQAAAPPIASAVGSAVSSAAHQTSTVVMQTQQPAPAGPVAFDEGGPWPSGTLGVNLSGHTERVLNPAETRLYEAGLGLPVHPVTGYRALGVTASGYPIWPVMGGAAKTNEYVGAEFFGVSQVPILGAIVNVLIRVLLSLIGVELEARDTMLKMTGEVRQFRGEFEAFDVRGQLYSDISGMIDRSLTSEEAAAEERIRILKQVIVALVKYIVEKVIVPIAKAVANAAIQAGATAASSGISAAGMGGGQAAGQIVGTLISAAGTATVDVAAEVGTDLALAWTDVLVSAIGDLLLSYFPELAHFVAGGKAFALLADPLAALFADVLGPALSFITLPLTTVTSSLVGVLSTLLGVLGGSVSLFDDGGVASGVGYMPKATLAPERVLSPQQTASFDRLVAALEKGGEPNRANQVVIHAPFTVTGDAAGGRRARDELLTLLS